MKKKLIYGIAYNVLADNDIEPSKIDFKLSKSEIYHHPRVRLNKSKDDLKLENKPIYLEHNTSNKIGSVLCSWLDDNQIKILAEVYGPDELIEQIECGDINSLSMGYVVDTKTNTKSIKEVSLCKEPFFDGCKFSVAASKKSYSLVDKKKSLFNNSLNYTDEVKFVVIMASGNAPNTSSDDRIQNLSKEDIEKILLEYKKVKDSEAEKTAKLSELTEQIKNSEDSVKKYQELFKSNQQKMFSDFMESVKSNGLSFSEDETNVLQNLFSNIDQGPTVSLLTKVVSSIKPQQIQTQTHKKSSSQIPQSGGLGDVYSAPKRSFSEMASHEAPSTVDVRAHKEPSTKKAKYDHQQEDNSSKGVRRILEDIMSLPAMPLGTTRFNLPYST
jgi:phage head maturation protease